MKSFFKSIIKVNNIYNNNNKITFRVSAQGNRFQVLPAISFSVFPSSPLESFHALKHV